MKKICLCLLLCLSVLLSLGVCAFADGTLGYVTDEAGILSSEELESLNTRAAEISEKFGLSVYIVVLNNYKLYNSESIHTCVEELYNFFDFGAGDKRDGLILLLSMAERDYDLWGHGPYAIYSFTDYGLNMLENSFLPYFRENNWVGGFRAYLNGAEKLLSAAAAGTPVSYSMPLWQKILIALLPSSLIGLIVPGIFKAQMKTAKERRDADEYVVQGRAHLRVKEDTFVNRTRSVHVIESSSGGGGSRGGSGGGTSHHSGKF